MLVEPFFQSAVCHSARSSSVIFKCLFRQLSQQGAQFSPSKFPAEHIAEDSVTKKSLFCAVIIVHRFLLRLFLMIPHSIFLQGGPGPETSSVGKLRHDRSGKPAGKSPGRKRFSGQAVLRLWTRSRRVLRTAPDNPSSAWMPDRITYPPSASS